MNIIMIMDGHIHIEDGSVNNGNFQKDLEKAGIDGGLVISLSPGCFGEHRFTYTNKERLDNLFSWVGDNTNLYPFYWIDPTEEDADEQVELAENMGVKGYKIICCKHYPGDSRAMKIYKRIAKAGKPILFHSGILWDGRPSSKYNRPEEFEALFDIDELKFSLAHISWPWIDESIAVYGKFLNAYSIRSNFSIEMFIDITPGTPPIYRKEALTKLFGTGYDIEDNIIFGVDSNTNHYNCKYALEWIQRDNDIYHELGIEVDVQNKIYYENLKRFVGVSTTDVKHRKLITGE